MTKKSAFTNYHSSIHCDLAIWGATVHGVMLAAEAVRSGKKVLLLNRYGFPGGRLTAALNLVQQIPDSVENEIFLDFLQAIVKDAIVVDENRSFLEPETLKYKLWEMAAQSGAKLLFHVLPTALKERDEQVTLNLAGREGALTVKCSELFDAGDDGLLLSLLKPEAVQITRLALNAIIHLDDLKYWESGPIWERFPITDQRVWLSAAFSPSKKFDLEAAFHQKLAQWHDSLQKAGGRIQLIPLEADREWTAPGAEPKFKHIRLSTGIESEPDQLLLYSLDAVKAHTML
ncbi:MAG TPA: FAD-dependent oxidoreductase [Candidatus Marinimicrobia bacterium]|nr:FAD-dependent oxidoreductase [Candidatus Neomarinimicrobiota bacterium]